MRSLIIILLIIASLAVLIGVVAKLQQWPGANMIMGAGLVTELLCAVLLIAYFWKRRGR